MPMRLHDGRGRRVAMTTLAVERALREGAPGIYTADESVSIFRYKQELIVANRGESRSMTHYGEADRAEAVADFLVRAALVGAERADDKEARKRKSR